MIWPRAAVSSAQKCAVQTEMLHFPTKQKKRCISTNMWQVDMESGFVKISVLKSRWRWTAHRQMFCCMVGEAAGVKGKPTGPAVMYRLEMVTPTKRPEARLKILRSLLGMSRMDGFEMNMMKLEFPRRREDSWTWRFSGQMFGVAEEHTTERVRWRQLICEEMEEFEKKKYYPWTCSNLWVYLRFKISPPFLWHVSAAVLPCYLSSTSPPQHPPIDHAPILYFVS